jgi:hypothetical protein
VKEFYLIDLIDQAPYLPQRVRSWSFEQLLSWLRVYGEVTIDPQRPRHFRFREWWALTGKYYDLFSYTEDGTLRFYGDHCLIVLWEPINSLSTETPISE